MPNVQFPVNIKRIIYKWFYIALNIFPQKSLRYFTKAISRKVASSKISCLSIRMGMMEIFSIRNWADNILGLYNNISELMKMFFKRVSSVRPESSNYFKRCLTGFKLLNHVHIQLTQVVSTSVYVHLIPRSVLFFMLYRFSR